MAVAKHSKMDAGKERAQKMNKEQPEFVERWANDLSEAEKKVKMATTGRRKQRESIASSHDPIEKSRLGVYESPLLVMFRDPFRKRTPVSAVRWEHV